MVSVLRKLLNLLLTTLGVYTQVTNKYFLEQVLELAVGMLVIQQVTDKLVVRVLVVVIAVVLLGKVGTQINLAFISNLYL